MTHISVLLLAAGASSRLGQPKQLLPWKGKTLLRHFAEIALALDPRATVVIGSMAERMQQEINGLPIQVAHNPEWESGMASSLRIGMRYCLMPDTEGIMVILCDQVYVNEELLRHIRQTFLDKRPLGVCTAYAGQLGVPALFDKKLFPQLESLTGDQGARTLIRQHKDQLLSIPFDQGAFDIDTPQDLRLL
jgi:molybdenum cofactor cytidylyltransferase